MTTTDTRPAASKAARLERAARLVAELLKGRGRGASPPGAVEALSRALAATAPKSGHGQLLFRTLRSLQGPGGKPQADDERAVWWLAQRGQTPSPGAVAARLAAAESARQTAAAVRAAVDRIADHDGPKAAAMVADIIARTGAGPTWRELAAVMGWPSTPYEVRFAAVTRLVHAGWLESGTAERSLRPGRKALASARRGAS
jgi:hypothetical protein